MAVQSGIAGSSSGPGTWTEASCRSTPDWPKFAVGVKIRHSYSQIKSIALLCYGGDLPSSAARTGRTGINWTGATQSQGMLTTSAVPNSVSGPFTTTDYVCPRNSYITGVGAGFVQSTNAIAGLHFTCAPYTQSSNGTWTAGSVSTVTTTENALGQIRVCGSNNPAKSASIKLTNGVPSAIRLTCDNPTRGRQAPTAEDLITRRTPMIKSPIISRVTNQSYVSNDLLMFVLKANVPGATNWKVQLSSPDGRINTPSQQSREGRTVSGDFYVGPFRVDPRLRGNTVSYRFVACTNDNKCSRYATGGFYACAKPTRGEGCNPAPGMITGGSGSGGGSTPPANALSFARDLYPVITTQCAGCHSSNSLYPQKLQTNAAQCGSTREPSIPFNTSMSASQMLTKLKCLRASSTSGTYAQAFGKVYVVPGNYQNSGLHWKAQNSSAFNQATKDLIRNWIAQGANP